MYDCVWKYVHIFLECSLEMVAALKDKYTKEMQDDNTKLFEKVAVIYSFKFSLIEGIMHFHPVFVLFMQCTNEDWLEYYKEVNIQTIIN